MNEVKIYGSDDDYREIEAALQSADIKCFRREEMYRTDGLSSHEVLIIAYLATKSIQAISKAVMARAKSDEAKHRQKICYTDGYGLHYFKNCRPEELEKVLPKTVAIYFGDTAGEDDPDSHRTDENAT
jgi:hypothetical protein